MSLNKFHMIFISVSIILLIGFAVWAVMRIDAGAGYLVTFILSALAAVSLGIYEWTFIKKQKTLV